MNRKPLTKEQHKERITNCKSALTTATKTMEKVWKIKKDFSYNDSMVKKFEELDSERRYNQMVEQLENYLKEAIEDGFPELVV